MAKVGSGDNWAAVSDTVSDVADMFGLGNFVDGLLNPQYWGRKESKEDMVNKAIDLINSKITPQQTQNQQLMQRVIDQLTAIMRTVPSPTVKDKINNWVSSLQKDYNTLTSVENKLGDIKTGLTNKAYSLQNERRSGAIRKGDRLNKQISQIADNSSKEISKIYNDIERRI